VIYENGPGARSQRKLFTIMRLCWWYEDQSHSPAGSNGDETELKIARVVCPPAKTREDSEAKILSG
jgi:hypothetical protein